MSKSPASPVYWTRVGRGRQPQNPKEIPFIDHWPLALKNHVSTRKKGVKDVPCLTETLAFLTCLKDHNNAHDLCMKESETVQKCYSTYLTQRYEAKGQKKTERDFQPEKNVKNMTPQELNRFLKHFPHKLPKK